MLQKFLDGKKKYSAMLLTLIAALIPVFVQQPEAQSELMELAPSIAAVIAGIFYIVTEGSLDKERAKASAAQALSGTATITQNGAQAAPAQPQQQIEVIQAPVEEPLDLKLFHERVLSDTEAKYAEQNPATVFFTARDKGSLTTCHDIKQAQDYWDYLVTLVYDAEQYVREQTQAGQTKDGCKVRSPEHVQMQHEVSKVIRYRDNVYTLAQTSFQGRIDWRAKLGQNDTLYHVGTLAEELMKAKV